jgi:predicted RNA-binding Zn-ribbon protein involved in translation (DUF1610 family)
MITARVDDNFMMSTITAVCPWCLTAYDSEFGAPVVGLVRCTACKKWYSTYQCKDPVYIAEKMKTEGHENVE